MPANKVKVMCPKCGNMMLYEPMKGSLDHTKKKRCVYCGRSFGVVERLR